MVSAIGMGIVKGYSLCGDVGSGLDSFCHLGEDLGKAGLQLLQVDRWRSGNGSGSSL